MRPKDAPAFPTGSDRSMDSRHWGLSKREHFAALFLAGYCANPEMVSNGIYILSGAAVKQADALLAELKKSEVEDASTES